MFAAGLVFVLGTGCGGPSEPLSLWQNLIFSFQWAESTPMTREVDLGSPSARPLLVSGWAPDDIVRPKDKFSSITWSEGPVSTLRFQMARPGDTTVEFTCAPLGSIDGRQGIMEILVNGRAWTDVELRSGFTTYKRFLPAALVQEGWNTLTMRLPPVKEVGETVNRVSRRIVWDKIVFGQSTAESALVPHVADHVLHLPPETEVAFTLDLPKDSWLAVSPAVATGEGGGTLMVTWSRIGDDLVSREELSLGTGQARLRLTGKTAERLRLVVSPSGEENMGLELSELLILRQAPQSEKSYEKVEGTGGVGLEPTVNATGGRVNILVYLVDALRADHLGCYGYNRPTTPQIDKFASQAVLFENAQAQSPWTRASVASVFSGLWPETHGAQDREHILSDKTTTLAEILQRDGYATFGFTGNGNSHAPWGFGQGFESLLFIRGRAGQHFARSEEIHEAALEWIDQRDTAKPFFLWVHTIDPHAPYEAPDPFRSEFAPNVTDSNAGSIGRLAELDRNHHTITQADIDTLINLYDAEVAANDASFGKLLDELRVRDLYDSTLIVFLSDHGEEFFDHGGWAHGKTLYSEMLDVPLIIKAPFQKDGLRLPDSAQHIDLLPTIVDYAGAPMPGVLPGRSLRGRMTLNSMNHAHPVAIAQMRLDGRVGSSMIEGQWKVVVRNYDGVEAFPRLHDRKADVSERKNFSFDEPLLAERLASEMRRIELTGLRLHDREELDLDSNPDLLEELKALGYVE